MKHSPTKTFKLYLHLWLIHATAEARVVIDATLRSAVKHSCLFWSSAKFSRKYFSFSFVCFVFLFRGGTYIHDLDEKFGKTRQRHGKSKQESLKQTTPAIHTELKIIVSFELTSIFPKEAGRVLPRHHSESVLYLDWLRSCELGDRSPDRYRLVWTLEIEISNTLCKVYIKQFSTVHEIFDVISWRHWTTDFKHWATCVEIKFLCIQRYRRFSKSSEKILKDIIHLKLAEVKEHRIEKEGKKAGNRNGHKVLFVLTNFLFLKRTGLTVTSLIIHVYK